MTRQTAVVVGLGTVALVVASVFASATADKSPTSAEVSMQPIDPAVAAKAEDSCWFKVRSRSGKTAEVKLWAAVSPNGASTERLGQLLIVTGAMEPAVRDDRFYGCSLFEYTAGSPMVMTAVTSPSPVRPDTVVPFGFSKDGMKQQR